MASNRPLHEVVAELDAKMSVGPWCKDYVYSQVRHVVRNVDMECFTHPWGGPVHCEGLGKYDGPMIAALRNALPQLAAVLKAADALVVAVEDGADTLEERIAYRTAVDDLRRVLEGK